MSILHLIVIGLVVLVVMGIVAGLIWSNSQKQKDRYMSVIQGGGGKYKGDNRKDIQNKRRAEIAKKLKEEQDEENGKKKKANTVSSLLSQAGANISVMQFWMASFALMVGLSLTAYMIGQPPMIVGLIAVTALLGIPRFILKKMAQNRQKKFLEEFPDALEAMVRLLKAGMPVGEAISMISREFTGPVGEEMTQVYNEQKIGISLHEAALGATYRMPITEMQMFATGLAIQAQTGSSLSEVLMNLSNVIRARFRLKRKVKALSSEAIASASIIGALPIVVAGGMYFLNTDYIMTLFTDPTGKIMLSGAVIWMFIGIFIMKLMINFKV